MKRFRLSRSLTILLLLFILGITVRFTGLGSNPAGIVDDEADAGYDAYSLLHTGNDQWAAPWPLTSFRGFGDYRLPVYTYLSMPSVGTFGLTPFAIRFPAALFGSLTIVVVYFLVTELFGPSSESFGLLAAFFLAVSPWHIGMSRIGLEETTSVFFVSLGLLMLLHGRRRGSANIASAVLFGVSLYVYTANIVLVPLLIALTVFLYRKSYGPFRKQICIGAVCLLLFSGGFILSAGTGTAATRTRQVNLTNDPALLDLVNEKQGACGTVLPRVVCRLVFNKYDAYATRLVSNYLNHYSPYLLSVYGTDTQYSVLPARGLLYLFDYAFIVVGLVCIFANVSPAGLLLTGWLFLSAIPDSLTSNGQYGRFFISYPVWSILTAFAVIFVLRHLKFRKALLALVVLCYVMAAGGFLVEYWTFFPNRYSQYSHFGYQDLIRKISENIPLYDHVIVSSRVNDTKQYIYYLFYSKYDPAVFQSGKGIEKVLEPNGWVRVKRINTVEFLPSLPAHDALIHTKDLLIGAPSEFPKTVPNVLPEVPVPVVFTVQDKAGHILFEAVDSSKLYL